ncbi:hypothetical protein BLA29_006924, partial [Euroglyphus maynei]
MSPEPELRLEAGNVDVNVDGTSFGLKDRFRRGKSKEKGKKSKDFEMTMPKIEVKKPKEEIGIDVDVSHNDVDSPKIEGDIDLSLKKKRGKSKEKSWEFGMPKFAFKGSKVNGPEADVDVVIPDMDVKEPTVEGGMNLSLKKKRSKSKEKEQKSPEPKEEKDWQLKMPKFTLKGPKVSVPDVDVNVEMPDVKLKGPKISDTDVSVNVEMPEDEIDLNISPKEKKRKDWEFKIPKLGFKGSKISGPDVDLKEPKAADPVVDVKVDSPKVNIEGPEVDADLNLSIDAKKSKKDGKDWEFHLPKFSFKGPKIQSPDLDIKNQSGKISAPEIKVDAPQMSASKLDGDLELSIDGKKPEGKDWEF